MISRTRWWEYQEKVLVRMPDRFEVASPSDPTLKWEDDMRKWPPVNYIKIVNYLMFAEGCDGDAMENYKSMESYNYFQSRKVGVLYIAAVSSELVIVSGEVTPSQAVNNEKLKAWVLCTVDGVIETAGCTCKAGHGKSCSHAGALLWKLEAAASSGRSGEACTDREQRWNQGTIVDIGPKRMSQVSFQRHKKNADLDPDAAQTIGSEVILPPIAKYLTHEDFQRGVEDSTVKCLAVMPGSMIAKAVTARIPLCTTPCPVLQHGDHSGENSCLKCRLFYDTYVNIDKEQLEKVTKVQSSSSAWHSSRRVRLTASTVKKVPVRATTDPTKFLREHMYPTFRGNKATRHGKESEPKALLKLESLGFSSTPSGTVLHEEEPWLSASPDGILLDGNIIEVKCPDVADIHGLLQAGKVVSDCHLIEGKPAVKKNGTRGYYLQMQMSMHCTGAEKCKFFIWCNDGHVLMDVNYDPDYVKCAVKRLKAFYFQIMLPRIVDDFDAGRLQLCAQYQALASRV